MKLAINKETQVDRAVGNVVLHVIQIVNEAAPIGLSNPGMPGLVPHLERIVKYLIALPVNLACEIESLVDGAYCLVRFSTARRTL